MHELVNSALKDVSHYESFCFTFYARFNIFQCSFHTCFFSHIKLVTRKGWFILRFYIRVSLYAVTFNSD